MMIAQRILFVCLGNICRSPSAEIILRHKLKAAGLDQHVLIDSCGTGAYHIGCHPDARMLHALALAGYEYDGHLSRQFRKRDFKEFDLIIPQDAYNQADILELASTNKDRAKVIPMSHWFSPRFASRYDIVPDPYYGGERGFSELVELLEEACERLIEEDIMPKMPS